MNGLLERIAQVVGPSFVITGEEARPYCVDWRKLWEGRALAVVRPANPREVAEVVKRCAEARTAVVPQGGNTGLVGGAAPDASGAQIVLSLSRLNRMRAIDPLNNTLTVEAGCTLLAVQQAAEQAARLFPLSLAAEGTAQIGGNLSTNAGGTAVLRYGNARELVLGLEVVLASGEVWDGLRGLRKDNTGYDLKQLFIGAEGTLGVITAAVLKLFPMPKARLTALAALPGPASALALLERLQRQCGERLTAFELFSRICLDLVFAAFPACVEPFSRPYAQYALIELSEPRSEEAAAAALEAVLGDALGAGIILDVVIAKSLAQGQALWRLRENISEAQAHEGPNLKHDVSIPVSRIAEFIAATDAQILRERPRTRLVTFGHLGDGNLHYNVSPPVGMDQGTFLGEAADITRIVHDSVAGFGGSISAEHGVGQAKREEIRRYKSALEIELMRKVKAALDPLGIMNPGKVI